MEAAGKYSIGAVARMTGVTTETLRAWERRYRLVAPGRDDRGRLYSEADVHKLRVLHELVGRGHSIGRLAPLSLEQLERLRSEPLAPSSPEGRRNIDFEPLREALTNFDSAALDRELGRAATLLPVREFTLEVAVPFLREVGDGWQAGTWSVAQEHLASAAVRTVLGTLVRLAGSGARARVVFAAPPDERHEFGILSAALLSAAAGASPLYLGADLPVEDIALAVSRTGAAAVALSAVGAAAPDEVVASVKRLAKLLPPGTALWAGGMGDEAFAARIAAAGATCVASLEEFEDRLRAAIG
ncbi:MAG TPA: MerR family transcriptional regulator [Myxococcales bacterium]|jgi:DNA-binding transcriptional MerR regulator/methylmalonyl-CoA mutase cobalamin-binding subunit